MIMPSDKARAIKAATEGIRNMSYAEKLITVVDDYDRIVSGMGVITDMMPVEFQWMKPRPPVVKAPVQETLPPFEDRLKAFVVTELCGLLMARANDLHQVERETKQIEREVEVQIQEENRQTFGEWA